VVENHFAFLLTFIAFVAFTVGFKTRAFHVVTLAGLISLGGRNVLLDSVGLSVAVALLAVTALLPLGARYSVDAWRASLDAVDEKTFDELNDRQTPAHQTMPASLAPIALWAILALVYMGAALQQTGDSWSDGSALYYALHVDRWASASGVWLRDASLLGGWTKALWAAETLIVPLVLIPVAHSVTRPLAIAAMLLHGLTFGVLFNFGLYGWSLVAAAALLIPTELWERANAPRRRLTLYYDDDCGICLWCARALKRLDARGNITFAPNSGELPEGVTRKMADGSMVVVDNEGRALTEADAMSALCRAVRPLVVVGWLIKLPGLNALAGAFYRRVAAQRLELSVSFGMTACGVPASIDNEGDDDGDSDETYAATSYRRAAGERATDGDDATSKVATSPAARLWHALGAVTTALCAAGIVLVVAAQTERANVLPMKLGLDGRDALADVALWARVTAPWGVFAPDPPKVNAALVIDATTRGGWNVDVLSGYEPDLDLLHPERARKGVLWDAYTTRIADDVNTPYRKELRRYLTRGGFAVDPSEPDNSIADLKAYWISVPIVPRGQARDGEITRTEIFSQRGHMGPDPRSEQADKPPSGIRPGGVPDPRKLPKIFPKR
jgi:predicted DCC family thiol-disulfide oxidoreductase YuxK